MQTGQPIQEQEPTKAHGQGLPALREGGHRALDQLREGKQPIALPQGGLAHHGGTRASDLVEEAWPCRSSLRREEVIGGVALPCTFRVPVVHHLACKVSVCVGILLATNDPNPEPASPFLPFPPAVQLYTPQQLVKGMVSDVANARSCSNRKGRHAAMPIAGPKKAELAYPWRWTAAPCRCLLTEIAPVKHCFCCSMLVRSAAGYACS